MVFVGRGFTSRGQELGSVFRAAVCKIQASKCYSESLPLMPKDKRSCFSQGERSTVQLLLNCVFALRKWFLWGVASLPEDKSWGLCLEQLCARYRLVSATVSPYH